MKLIKQLETKINNASREIEECKVLINNLKANARAKELTKQVPDYKLIIDSLQDRFGKSLYYNDKRKSFRRLKIRIRHTDVPLIKKHLRNKFGDKILETQFRPLGNDIRNIGSMFVELIIKLPL